MNMLKRIGSIHKGSTHRKGRKKHVLFKAFNEKTKNDPGKVSQIPLKKKTAKKRRVLQMSASIALHDTEESKGKDYDTPETLPIAEEKLSDVPNLTVKGKTKRQSSMRLLKVEGLADYQ